MELALYHPEHGYYASRAQCSGRGGDFYTSVDAGPLFGELLAVQIADMARRIQADGPSGIDLVEAGAGNGRLMRDVLDALAREFPAEYARMRVHLVELSERARERHREVLGPHAPLLATSGAQLPHAIDGVVYANELLDAFPVHVVVRREEGLREIYVGAAGDWLVEREGPLSTPALQQAIEASGVQVPQGARAEIAPGIAAWIRDVAARLHRGFLIVIDYGDEAAVLRSPARPEGTLRAFRGHRVSGRWLDAPGEQDLTAHVDFTAVDRAAREAGLRPLGRTEQAKFLIALGALDRLEARAAALPATDALRWRLAAKTLLVPGTVGWTHSVALFGKEVGVAWRPAAHLAIIRGFGASITSLGSSTTVNLERHGLLALGGACMATTMAVEREIKLRFDTADAARAAILAAGATPLRCRRLQDDFLLDTEDETLRRRRCVLRVRMESGKSRLTFKGPVQPAAMKLREEIETMIADGEVLLRVFEELGLHVWFRYQKYREEFSYEDVIAAIDETPVGTFVELEGSERGIEHLAAALGQTPSDFILDSYRGLFLKHRDEAGLAGNDMVFEP